MDEPASTDPSLALSEVLINSLKREIYSRPFDTSPRSVHGLGSRVAQARNARAPGPRGLRPCRHARSEEGRPSASPPVDITKTPVGDARPPPSPPRRRPAHARRRQSNGRRRRAALVTASRNASGRIDGAERRRLRRRQADPKSPTRHAGRNLVDRPRRPAENGPVRLNPPPLIRLGTTQNL